MPREVRIRVICSSLCHVDLAFSNMQDPPGFYPRILGHEAIGFWVGMWRLPLLCGPGALAHCFSRAPSDSPTVVSEPRFGLVGEQAGILVWINYSMWGNSFK
ncbi:alcohol dehydrogenase 7-like protein, partial [Trifolium pratense]